jgi:hypothetical protein
MDQLIPLRGLEDLEGAPRGMVVSEQDLELLLRWPWTLVTRSKAHWETVELQLRPLVVSARTLICGRVCYPHHLVALAVKGQIDAATPEDQVVTLLQALRPRVKFKSVEMGSLDIRRENLLLIQLASGGAAHGADLTF